MTAVKTPMLVNVGVIVTVRITYAATRNSNPSESDLPKESLYVSHELPACFRL